jgi:hypothetical protein
MAKMWDADLMDAFNDLWIAYGQRYNSHPLVECVYGEETTLNITNPDGSLAGGFTPAAYFTEYKRHVRTVQPYWNKTIFRLLNNWGPTPVSTTTEEINLLALEAPGMAIGGPDSEKPEYWDRGLEKILANRYYRGLDGGTNLIGQVPWIGEVQDSGLGSQRRVQTPQQIWEYQRDYQKATHMVWVVVEIPRSDMPYATSAQAWSTGVLPYIRSINGLTNTTAFNGWQ